MKNVYPDVEVSIIEGGDRMTIIFKTEYQFIDPSVIVSTSYEGIGPLKEVLELALSQFLKDLDVVRRQPPL